MERVIGLVCRKYSILQGILPIQLVTARRGDDLAPIDKVAIICCALTNLSESIVHFDKIFYTFDIKMHKNYAT